MTQSYYETMYILRPDIPEEEVETHVTKYRDLVTESGGVVLDCQMRGKRRLAYSIAKHREGIYVQLNHDGDGQQVAPMERAMRLSEDVIRYLTVKQDGPMPPPRVLPSQAETTPVDATAAETEAD
jgi:small subunit ribosomal protein S6